MELAKLPRVSRWAWNWARAWARLGGVGDHLPYEFCGGMAYCEPHIGPGLMPQIGLETLQPEGQAGARVESNSEGALPGPCAVCLCAMKLEKVEPSPKKSQDMKALRKELDQFTKLLTQKTTPLGTPSSAWGSPGRSLWKGIQRDNHLPL